MCHLSKENIHLVSPAERNSLLSYSIISVVFVIIYIFKIISLFCHNFKFTDAAFLPYFIVFVFLPFFFFIVPLARVYLLNESTIKSL